MTRQQLLGSSVFLAAALLAQFSPASEAETHPNRARYLSTCNVTALNCGNSVAPLFGSSGCRSTDGRTADYFSLNAAAGSYVAVQLDQIDSSLSSPELALFPPDYDSIGNPPVIRGGGRLTIRYVFTTNGTWEIGVLFAGSTGHYRISTGCSANPTPDVIPASCVTQTLECNQSVDWTLSLDSCVYSGTTANRYAYFSMYLDANRNVTAKMVARYFDPLIHLYRNGGLPIVSSSSGVANLTPAILGFTPVTAGVHQLAATSTKTYPSGPFTLSTQCACAGARIVADLVSFELENSSTASLSVGTAGDPPIHYAWYRGIKPDTSVPVGFDAPMLTLNGVNATEHVWVHVWNACGSADSSTATITVPPCVGARIVADLVSFELKNGSTASLSVGTAGDPPIHYAWYRGIKPDTSVPVGFDAPMLTLNGVNATEHVWVHVWNACGSADSSTATITVPPRGRRRAVGR
jgi:hypothetical protein